MASDLYKGILVIWMYLWVNDEYAHWHYLHLVVGYISTVAIAVN